MCGYTSCYRGGHKTRVCTLRPDPLKKGCMLCLYTLAVASKASCCCVESAGPCWCFRLTWDTQTDYGRVQEMMWVRGGLLVVMDQENNGELGGYCSWWLFGGPLRSFNCHAGEPGPQSRITSRHLQNQLTPISLATVTDHAWNWIYSTADSSAWTGRSLLAEWYHTSVPSLYRTTNPINFAKVSSSWFRGYHENVSIERTLSKLEFEVWGDLRPLWNRINWSERAEIQEISCLHPKY